LQYMKESQPVRRDMRRMCHERGHTHMAVCIRSVEDIGIGTFDYYGDGEHVVSCLTELLADGLGPVVFLADDADRSWNVNLTRVWDVWSRELPKWAHLCSALVPSVQCNGYWSDDDIEDFLVDLRMLLPAAYLLGHFTAGHYYAPPKSVFKDRPMNGILWQFDIWSDDEAGNPIGQRRGGRQVAEEIARTDKLTGPGRERASPARQARADGLDFIAVGGDGLAGASFQG